MFVAPNHRLPPRGAKLNKAMVIRQMGLFDRYGPHSTANRSIPRHREHAMARLPTTNLSPIRGSTIVIPDTRNFPVKVSGAQRTAAVHHATDFSAKTPASSCQEQHYYVISMCYMDVESSISALIVRLFEWKAVVHLLQTWRTQRKLTLKFLWRKMIRF